MGEAKSKTQRMAELHPRCIFCGGQALTATTEHCPPRAVFRGRAWPEGFEFPACLQCNGGSSDEDLIAAFLSHLSPGAQGAELEQGKGLMFRVGRQKLPLLRRMFTLSVTERRQAARELGWTPAPGQTHDDFPVVRVPAEAHAAIRTFAGKLTKALYWMQTGSIFPADGGVLFHWFTNADLMRDGRIAVLDGFGQIKTDAVPLHRGGKDLSDQLGIQVGVNVAEGLALVMATFRQAFGFVTVAYATPGAAAQVLEQAKAASGREDGPFELL